MIQTSTQILEIRGKGNGSFVSEKIGLPSSLRRNFRKIVLAPVNWPLHTAEMTDAAGKDRVDKNARFLGLLDCCVDVRVGRPDTSEAVDAIRNHQNFMS